MAEPKRYAVVTGGNKGIGFGICRLLASHGITVVLTARDEKRGFEALQNLKNYGDFVLFHQLDVVDPSSVSSLAEFIKNRFGKLDILVNNAGISGVQVDYDSVKASIEEFDDVNKRWEALMSGMTQTYDSTVECLETNYYGAKRVVEAFLPLLQLSQSPVIVNVSSTGGKLSNMTNEWAKGILSNVENLTEERVDEVIKALLKDFKEGSLEACGWPVILSGYRVSKAAMNAYTRILAKRHGKVKVNCVCPGYGKTDMTFHLGNLTVDECAENVVKLALLPDDGPSGLFFARGQVSPFE